MPSKLRKPPTYRLHKPTGQAVVRIDGHDFYLGKHGTEAGRSIETVANTGQYL